MNILNKNEVTKKMLNNLSILYEKNYLEISMYDKLLSLKEEEILFSNITVKGSSLKVIYIDKYLIKVCGNINSISRRDLV